MSHISSFCSIYPVNLTLQVKDQRSRHEHMCRKCSTLISCQRSFFQPSIIASCWGKGGLRVKNGGWSHLHALQHLSNILAHFCFLPFSPFDVEWRHSVNPRLGSRAMPQPVSDFYKNPPVLVNICVGKSQHEASPTVYLSISAPTENVEFKYRKLFC